MEEKLTINELKYYLGTGVKVRTPKYYLECGKYSYLEMIGLCINKINGKEVHQYELIEGDGELTFPELHPLSSLTKPIVVEGYNNGEPFVPISKIQGVIGGEYIWNYLYNNQGDFNVNYVRYEALQLLLQWHFDVFGLIDRRLAVSKEEVKL